MIYIIISRLSVREIIYYIADCQPFTDSTHYPVVSLCFSDRATPLAAEGGAHRLRWEGLSENRG